MTVPKPLDAIFKPGSVALIGATDEAGSVGRMLLENLLAGGLDGPVYPVNPHRGQVLGQQAYPSVSALPTRVDLAVVATPARTVPGIIRECGAAGVGGAVVISAGFKEAGAEGVALEAELMRAARSAGIRLIGPNCLGVMRPDRGLNATFAARLALPGRLAFVSQSGALCTSILDWSEQERVGFSAFVSLGSMADLGWGELIDDLGDDERTDAIVLYMESVGDARAFVRAASRVAGRKPIIAIKPGRTAPAARAAASHTGALTGSDAVLDAAFQRCGVLRVDTIAQLFDHAELLAKSPPPVGKHLTILTNAGGPGVLATDALIEAGGALTALAPRTLEALDACLPPHWSHANPIDIIGDAGVERFRAALEVVLREPGGDGLLVILSPQKATDPTAAAEALCELARGARVPVLASWMGGARIAPGEGILNRAGIPTYRYPDDAARAFVERWRHQEARSAVHASPAWASAALGPEAHLPKAELDPDPVGDARSSTARLLSELRTEGRRWLTEAESKQLLALYGIPSLETRIARDPESAVEAAEDIGYPVAVKLHSETLTHKRRVGGVKLDVRSGAEVRRAFAEIESSVRAAAGEGHVQGVTVQPMLDAEGYELILGSKVDPDFGPVLLFGSGGSLVEVYRDRAIGLPPLDREQARRLMARTRIYEALRGERGVSGVDLPALEGWLMRFSRLVIEQPAIEEIDINPLVAGPEGCVALDARVLLHPRGLVEDARPSPVRIGRGDGLRSRATGKAGSSEREGAPGSKTGGTPG